MSEGPNAVDWENKPQYRIYIGRSDGTMYKVPRIFHTEEEINEYYRLNRGKVSGTMFVKDESPAALRKTGQRNMGEFV